MSLDERLSNAVRERVEINQRNLIDKVLARYSSEFVVYRELMQNSDDAKSTSIDIRFETKNNEKVTQIIFKNNGTAFSPDDWERLKTIAEGNPDVEKIGAFGIGFYSLFSICENPRVSSGGQVMAFYWDDKDQLYIKRVLNTGVKDKLTTFNMDMREPVEFPKVEEFTQFLVNSLVFTVNIRDASVYFDDTLVIQLSKRMNNPESINVKSVFNSFSPQRMFRLDSVDVKGVQLNVKRLSVPTNISAIQLHSTEYNTEEKSIFFRIASGKLDVKISNTFSAEMKRITKKGPPSKTTIQMVFTGFDEHNSSGDISPFSPYPEQGKIYIGFSTHQTTGCCSHLAARVIPTAERESIDLAQKTLAKYNIEMLHLGGTLCRILYENEMDRIASLYNNSCTNDDKNHLEKQAAHTLTHFTFNQSTPDARVGKVMESQFFNCSKQKLSILSTIGVFPISDVRMPNSEMAGFIKRVPVVPKIILEQCDAFFKEEKYIKELDFQDVLNELESRILSEDEMIELLKWWISYRSEGNNVNGPDFEKFMKFARIGSNRALNTIRYFLNPGTIPPDVANVDSLVDVLPYTISQKIKIKNNKDLKEWFNWSELSLVKWAEHIVSNPKLEYDSTFAEKVHQTLAKNLNNTSSVNKEIIRQAFARKKCIPTNIGMKFPEETYFQNVDLFPDLPTIQFQSLSKNIPKLMELLGVRKVVELELIFYRLDNQNGQEGCNHIKLAKYLASKSNDLKIDEMNKLKNKPIWPKENLQSNNIERFIARDLYIPSALHRKFGLPIIDWKGGLSRNAEGKFLIKLGLQEYPTLEKIMELAAHPTDPNIRKEALEYFIRNFEERYINYNPKVNIAFLPCEGSDTYAKPSECFINPGCKTMNFQVVRQDLQHRVGKFGVRQNPDHKELLNRLKENPPNDKAKEVFEYLESQQTHFTNNDLDILADLKFIPIYDNDGIIYANPSSCFFKVQEEMLTNFFTCVDFGEKANKFLQNCGVKNEPTPIDFAELLVKSSAKLLDSFKDVEKYLNVLRLIAFNLATISRKSSLIAKMKENPILVAVEMEDSKKIIQLTWANKIFINDDKIYQKIFNPLTAPEEDLLETLYKALGSKSLHDSVKETSIPVGDIKETDYSRKIQGMITERACLFYFECDNEIRRDDEWLKTLKVRKVDSIKTRYILESVTEIEKYTDSCILHDENIDSWILYIASNSGADLDISRQLAKNIYNSYNWKDISYLNMLLTTSLLTLEQMGYPVERILQRQHVENQIRVIRVESYASQTHSDYYDPNYTYQPFDGNISIPNPETFENEEPVLNFENILTLQNFLQDAIKDYYSNTGNITSNQTDVKVSMQAYNYNLDSVKIQTIETYISDVKNIQMNHCNIVSDNSLYCIGTLQDIKLYAFKGHQQSEILSHSAQLNQFINILKYLADVFELTTNAIRIFYNNNSNSIAFNRDRALFFNLKFYLTLHHAECRNKPTVNAMTYWFVMFCHELAHNNIQFHNSKHEYYFSLFTEVYMSKFLEMLRKREILP